MHDYPPLENAHVACVKRRSSAANPEEKNHDHPNPTPQNFRKEFFRVPIGAVHAALKRLAPSAPFFAGIEAQRGRSRFLLAKQCWRLRGSAKDKNCRWPSKTGGAFCAIVAGNHLGSVLQRFLERRTSRRGRRFEIPARVHPPILNRLPWCHSTTANGYRKAKKTG